MLCHISNLYILTFRSPSCKKWQTNTSVSPTLYSVFPGNQRLGQNSIHTSFIIQPLYEQILWVHSSACTVFLSLATKAMQLPGASIGSSFMYAIVRHCSIISGLSAILRMSLFFLDWPHSPKRHTIWWFEWKWPS